MAMLVATELTSVMTTKMSRIASTAYLVAACMPAISALIYSVALAVWLARPLTSDATTAKPLLASPARAVGGQQASPNPCSQCWRSD
jgi:hypothetical protein